MKVLLKDYINKYYTGVRADFARAQGVLPQQVTKWLANDWLVIDGRLYSPKQELKGYKNERIN